MLVATVQNLAWPGAVTMQVGVPQVHVDPAVPTADEVYYEGLAAGPSYNDDAAAAAGGVAIGERYRNGNLVVIRIT